MGIFGWTGYRRDCRFDACPAVGQRHSGFTRWQTLRVDWIRSHPQVRKSVLRSRISPTRRRKTSQKPSTRAKRLTEHLEPRARRLSLAGALANTKAAARTLRAP